MNAYLLLTLVFPPDGVSTAVLMGELAQDLQARGLTMEVLTTTPHYNVDSAARQSQPLQRHWGGLFFSSTFHKIPVWHAAVSPKGNRVIARLWDYLRFHLVTLWLGLRLPRPKVILAPSPPLTVGIIAWLLACWHRVSFVYNVQEIYPDVAVQLGMLRNRAVIGVLAALERFIYARAHKITVISEWFRRNLLEKGVPPDKLVVIPNFVDTDFMYPRARQNDFAQQQHLLDKFVIQYAGNIGLTQDFETILAAATLLQDQPDIQFVLVGDGARREWLAGQLAQGLYPNVCLLPYLPRSVIPDLYATADVCLVPLKAGTASQTFPSKIYTIMAAGRAVIATAEPETELAWVVEQAKSGWVVTPGLAADLAAAVRQAYQQRATLNAYGSAGRAYVVAHHSRQAVAEQYAQLLQVLTR
jgi:colanic acid biosynthesis glycosyl transferase WcaI